MISGTAQPAERRMVIANLDDFAMSGSERYPALESCPVDLPAIVGDLLAIVGDRREARRGQRLPHVSVVVGGDAK